MVFGLPLMLDDLSPYDVEKNDGPIRTKWSTGWSTGHARTGNNAISSQYFTERGLTRNFHGSFKNGRVPLPRSGNYDCRWRPQYAPGDRCRRASPSIARGR